MINVTVAGRVGKDSELRQAGQSQVLSFSVAGDTGFGDRKQSHWFNCSIWGNQGAALEQYLKKGQQVTVIGEYSEREHNGKYYKELRVNSIELQGSKGDNQQNNQQNNQQQPSQNNHAPNPYAQQMAQNAQGMQDTINQQFARQNQGFNNQMSQAPQGYGQNGAPQAPEESIPF